ncbi:hypothetical protein LFAB_17015 [Lactiplantibacillus fabifermentans T30PCM01]|uniref:NAD(P)-binding domain-containing protein n=1 Tax=Lactiplantibacillus fabifermentans T30PCM01 TaxID=1400520 RepID=W6T4I4_9LACO|nr:NAD(P)H-binding protein [Lactiplantibacillus fabifermentans]ETY72618.1 hypothetical protein LFAB_17015 [Lactiplantibacillus fabifermentans T30PCM01]
MKRVLVIGATGRIGRLVVNELAKPDAVQVTAFSRMTSNNQLSVPTNVRTIKGDLSNRLRLHDLIARQDFVVVATAGDFLLQAQQLVAAMAGLTQPQIIWVTGLGIHQEVPGKIGAMLSQLAKQHPDYVAAADTIVNSGQKYLLLRCAALTDAPSGQYVVSAEGQAIHSETVSRQAVAHLIADVVVGRKVAPAYASWGVTQ